MGMVGFGLVVRKEKTGTLEKGTVFALFKCGFVQKKKQRIYYSKCGGIKDMMSFLYFQVMLWTF